MSEQHLTVAELVHILLAMPQEAPVIAVPSNGGADARLCNGRFESDYYGRRDIVVFDVD